MSAVKTVDIQCTGYRIQADYYAGDDSHIVLFFIGWTSSKAIYGRMASAISELSGASAYVLEYSGHGESSIDLQTTCPAQHFLEVIHMFDWVRDKHPDAELTVVGTSYGGFLAAQLTKYREFRNLVLRVPAMYRPQDFYSPPSVWAEQEMTRKFRADASAVAEHPLLKRAAAYDGNTLVVVHAQDEAVPPQTTDAYSRAFSADLLTFDMPHGTPGGPPELLDDYQSSIAAWITKHK